jgi:ketosteroid isomerase-like protein
VAVAVLTAGVAACAGSAQAEFGMKDQASIRGKNAALVKAFNAKEVPALLDLYADNSTFMPPNRPEIKGREPLKIFYTEMLNEDGASDLHLDVAEVSGSGTLAYQTGTYEMQMKRNGAPSHDRGKYLFVLRNVAGQWRYEYSMWNSDLPVGD